MGMGEVKTCRALVGATAGAFFSSDSHVLEVEISSGDCHDEKGCKNRPALVASSHVKYIYEFK